MSLLENCQLYILQSTTWFYSLVLDVLMTQSATSCRYQVLATSQSSHARSSTYCVYCVQHDSSVSSQRQPHTSTRKIRAWIKENLVQNFTPSHFSYLFLFLDQRCRFQAFQDFFFFFGSARLQVVFAEV